MLTWLGDVLSPRRPAAGEVEEAWAVWLDGGAKGPPPDAPPDPSSEVMRRLLVLQVAAGRAAAMAEDPTTARRYGLLPVRSCG